MKPRLLILSDVRGLEHCPWIGHYVELLSPVFSIQLYDSCVLGNVAVADAAEETVHAAFIHGGIGAAADKLLKLERAKVDILAFSMGGSIAWEAARKGMDVGHLNAVSATRLRLQREVPTCKINLFYGADDPFQPTASWFEQLELDPPIIERGGHDLYAGPASVTRICERVMAGSSIRDLARGGDARK